MINTYDVSSVPDIKTELKVGLELDKTQLQARNNVVHIVESPIEKLGNNEEKNYFDSILEGITEEMKFNKVEAIHNNIDLFNKVSKESLFKFFEYNLKEQYFDDVFGILERYELIHRFSPEQILLLLNTIHGDNIEKVRFLQLEGIPEVLQNSGK